MSIKIENVKGDNPEEPKGDTPCPVCNVNGVFEYSPHEDCICQGRAWLWKLGNTEWRYIKVFMDGNRWYCIGVDFDNLQSSGNFAFGDTRQAAVENYGRLMLQ